MMSDWNDIGLLRIMGDHAWPGGGVRPSKSGHGDPGDSVAALMSLTYQVPFCFTTVSA